MRLQAGLEMLGKVPPSSRHPAGSLDALSGYVMVRVLFVMCPGVIADDRVDSRQTESKDEPRRELDPRNLIHPVVAVIEVEDFLTGP